ncbi:MAG TPA: rod shape-determining protein MreC [Patescibacteria group bacterium]|nr:rod shape-determining protein MreC [Patescibacteria group bacterium]
MLLSLGDYLKILNLPKSLLQKVTIPIQYGLYQSSLSVTRQFEFVLNARKASQENKALSEQLALVLSKNADLRKKLAEAESFSEQKKALPDQTFNLTPARPMGHTRYLFIDRGGEDGIKPNQVVIFEYNFIGKIAEVEPKKSKVILVTDPDMRVSAFSQSEAGRAKGVLLGQFGSEMMLDKILHEEPVKEGDLVYSEGQETEIPRGLILGQVSQVIEKDNDVFKRAKVKPVFDIADLEVVFVVGE